MAACAGKKQQGDFRGTHAQALPQAGCFQIIVGDVHQGHGGMEDKTERSKTICRRIAASKIGLRGNHERHEPPLLARALSQVIHTQGRLAQIFRQAEFHPLTENYGAWGP